MYNECSPLARLPRGGTHALNGPKPHLSTFSRKWLVATSCLGGWGWLFIHHKNKNCGFFFKCDKKKNSLQKFRHEFPAAWRPLVRVNGDQRRHYVISVGNVLVLRRATADVHLVVWATHPKTSKKQFFFCFLLKKKSKKLFSSLSLHVTDFVRHDDAQQQPVVLVYGGCFARIASRRHMRQPHEIAIGALRANVIPVMTR